MAATILTFVSSYLPGVKAGGPIRSVSSLVNALGDEFQFKIVTRDRDPGDTEPYAGVETDTWVDVGRASVMYLSPGNENLFRIASMMRSTEFDLLYINSFFSSSFACVPLAIRRYGVKREVPAIVFPRGQFHAGALTQKSVRKNVYKWIAARTGVHRDVVWQATSKIEEACIREAVPQVGTIYQASNIGPRPLPDDVCSKSKESGKARIACLSRVVPVKNLAWAIEALRSLESDIRVELDVYGPIEDPEYWQLCQNHIAQLPATIDVNYRGVVDNCDVQSVLADYDLSITPSLSENYGYVIAEALGAGTPVLISDQTPWAGLTSQKAGWDVPLDSHEQFADAVRKIASMSPEEHVQWRNGAKEFLKQSPFYRSGVEQHRTMFQEVIQQRANVNSRVA